MWALNIIITARFLINYHNYNRKVGLLSKFKATIHALCIFSCLMSLHGCSSIYTHSQDLGEWGHPYSGTERAINGLELGLVISSMALFIPAPFILADVPLSFVIDTAVLPIDLLAPTNKSRSSITYVPSH